MRAAFAILAAAVMLSAAAPLTPIQDTVTAADGSRFTGSITVSWSSFTASDGSDVPGGARVLTVNGGLLRAALIPFNGYTAVYLDTRGSTSREYWGVPNSVQPVRLADLRAAAIATLPAAPDVFVKTFASATTYSILAGEHGFAGGNILWKCFETGTGARVYPSHVTLGATAPDLTLTFLQPVAASCRVTAGGLTPNYRGAFNSAQTITFSATQHHFQSTELEEQCYDGSTPRVGFRHGTLAIDAGYNVTTSLSQPLTGVCILGKR